MTTMRLNIDGNVYQIDKDGEISQLDIDAVTHEVRNGCIACGRGILTFPTCPTTINPRTVIVTPSASGGVAPYTYDLKLLSQDTIRASPLFFKGGIQLYI